jgi:hypothetical protein
MAMAMPRLRERTLSGLSKIRVSYFVGPSSRKPYLEILVVKYVGTYRPGSLGNDDARFMYAMAMAGVAAFEPWGVVHDLSELKYTWGDQLDTVFTAGPQNGPESAVPVAVVVGPRCEQAVRTLLLGVKSQEPLESVGFVFRDLESAWAFVEEHIP